MKTLRRMAFTAAIALMWQTLPGETATNVTGAVNANNAFAVDLFRQVAKRPGNFVFSPYSVHTALAMTYAGARGLTARKMGDVLYFSNENMDAYAEVSRLLRELKDSGAPGNEIDIANSLWARKGFPIRKEFETLVHSQFDATFQTIDLAGRRASFDRNKAAAARGRINEWVATQTHDKICSILPPGIPDTSTCMILVNAIYFNGLWATPFKRVLTNNMPFYISAGKSVSVPVLHVQGHFRYSDSGDVQTLELPYVSNRLSMVILMPGRVDGLSQLEQKFTAQMIDDLFKTGYSRGLDLLVPTFNINFQMGLNRPLQKMGMEDAFEETADFSNISTAKPLFINTAIHEACITVDATGTTAAAVTMMHLANGIVMWDPVWINHPFLFVIRDNATGVILFIGRVANPLQGD